MSREENMKRTLLSMLSQRGYKDINDSSTQYLIATKKNKNICVFLEVVAKLNTAEIQKYINMLNTMGSNHCILVYKTNTPSVKNIIKEANNIGLEIELFTEDELQYNITEHVLVPTHKALNKRDCKEFKDKHGSQVPVLLRTDPICRFYNFRKGSIIKVTRRNGFVAYRIVK